MTESATPMLEIWDQMYEGLVLNARLILSMINYYDRYDVLPSIQGSILSEEEKEGLYPIVRILMDSAIKSDAPRPGIMLSTLDKVFTGILPVGVQWEISHDYRRDEEKPGTYCLDVWGDEQTQSAVPLAMPSAANIARAAKAAYCRIKVAGAAGRPLNSANRILAQRMGEVFRSSGLPVARRREPLKMFCAKVVYEEKGLFRDFLELVLPPLDKFLREKGLSPVTIDTVVRFAIEGG
jgi:hypothetical protein